MSKYSLETPLDSMYYRTPAKPHLCGPYKYSSNYNGCSFAEVAKTEAPSRTDYKYKKTESFVDSQLSAVAPPKIDDKMLINQILASPMAFDLTPMTQADKLAFITRNISNKQLMEKIMSLKNVKNETKSVIDLIPTLSKSKFHEEKIKKMEEEKEKLKTKQKKEKFYENFSILGFF